ncbi:MAG: pyrroline-5-carboxylate reductase [Alphaproteobacteria bacterium]|nr:pyrroline-5-carboxylate reductase [Alphaproteobacteria bacterium]
MPKTGTQNPSLNHITLVGCGNMGRALLQGWLQAKIGARYFIVEPEGLPETFRDSLSITYAGKQEEIEDAIKKSDIIVMAIKPQIMDEICKSIKPYISKKALILSIAAGRTIAGFEAAFGEAQPVIRCMPNTPASIGKGMSVLTANKNAGDDQKKFAEKLMKCVGEAEWTEDENLMNAVTALSGSGPAYVFYLVEALAKAGQKAGLKPALAMTLARQMVVGAAALAEARPDISAEQLRRNVTSPGGTTEAALNILMNGELQKLLDEALQAAIARGEELSS